jgi:hypothetical protein
MKIQTSFLAAVLLAVAWIPQTAPAKELSELKLLYIGSERAEAFVTFLKTKVAKIEARPRAGFEVTDADPFDVVLLDWPQSEETREMRKLTSPLGTREAWTKPTVLLGSAGLNLAVAWRMKGGIGCTCMDPLAYDLREHEIFERPVKIDRSKMISIPTPKDFQFEIKDSKIKVLPLVDNHQQLWKAGWCTYAYDFANNPDVEYFSGGVNAKTPTAAGLWRQGNFLHFGFEQSPAEMNEQGGMILINSIAYISRFTEDRPIAVTPSPFAGPITRPRRDPARFLRNPEYKLDWVKQMVAPEVWTEVQSFSREKTAEWFDQNQSFLHPSTNHQLELDPDLVALGVSFDKPEFFDKVIAELRTSSGASPRARRLLARYAPIGPMNGSADDWTAWWRENKAYAFASDSSDYRWYIDPLAKQRRVPTSELRGPMRADTFNPKSNR